MKHTVSRKAFIFHLENRPGKPFFQTPINELQCSSYMPVVRYQETDPDLPVEQVIRYYVWRWDIEVNFRDEKQVIGAGQAQVWSPNSAENVPAFAVIAYSILLLAGRRAFGDQEIPGAVPPPSWRRRSSRLRYSTRDLVRHLKTELWGENLGVDSFGGFMEPPPDTTNPRKVDQTLASAVVFAQ